MPDAYRRPTPTTGDYADICDTTVGDKLQVRVSGDALVLLRAGDITVDDTLCPLFLEKQSGDLVTFTEDDTTVQAVQVKPSDVRDHALSVIGEL